MTRTKIEHCAAAVIDNELDTDTSLPTSNNLSRMWSWKRLGHVCGGRSHSPSRTIVAWIQKFRSIRIVICVGGQAHRRSLSLYPREITGIDARTDSRGFGFELGAWLPRCEPMNCLLKEPIGKVRFLKILREGPA